MEEEEEAGRAGAAVGHLPFLIIRGRWCVVEHGQFTPPCARLSMMGQSGGEWGVRMGERRARERARHPLPRSPCQRRRCLTVVDMTTSQDKAH